MGKTYCEHFTGEEILRAAKELLHFSEGTPLPSTGIVRRLQAELQLALLLTPARSFSVTRACIRDEVMLRYVTLVDQKKAGL